MARKRPKASDVTHPVLTCLDGGMLPVEDQPLLTRAEAGALRRSAPLTHAQLQHLLEGIPSPPLRSV